MPNQQAIDYAKNELSRGVSPENVRSSLLVQGWTLKDIDEAFEAAGMHAHVAALFGAYVAPGPLLGVAELFASAWGIFKKRFLAMVLVAFIGIIPAVALLYGLSFFEFNTFFSKALVLGGFAVVAFFMMVWMGTALLFSVRDDMEDNGVFGSYRHASKKILTIVWTSILSIFVVFGGATLFLVPGVVAALWLFVVRFVVVVEDDKGMRAIAKSKAYVTGRWWAVFGRIFVMVVATSVILALVDALLSALFGVSPFATEKNIPKEILGLVVSMLVGLYMLTYSYALYTSLRSSRPEISIRAESPSGILTAFIGVALAVVIVVLWLVYLMYVGAPPPFEGIRQTNTL